MEPREGRNRKKKIVAIALGTTLAAIGASSVENNLTVLRTGRDEGRVTLDSRFFRRLGGFVEGFRRAAQPIPIDEPVELLDGADIPFLKTEFE